MSQGSRPSGVTIIAVAYGVGATLAWFRVLANRESGYGLCISLFQVVLISAMVWGLWNLRGWGRVLTIIWSIAAITYGFYTTPHALSVMTRGDTYPMGISLGRTVLHGAALVYLLHPKTAAAFRHPA